MQGVRGSNPLSFGPAGTTVKGTAGAHGPGPQRSPTDTSGAAAPRSAARSRDPIEPVIHGMQAFVGTRSVYTEPADRGVQRTPAVDTGTKHRRSARQPSREQAALWEAGQSSSLPPGLPRALRALANEAVVTEEGPRPLHLYSSMLTVAMISSFSRARGSEMIRYVSSPTWKASTARSIPFPRNA
jgi:hypothetical protein